MRLTIIDRYLLGKYWRTFAGILASCAALLILVEILDNFQDIAENETPLSKTLAFFVLFLPYKIIEVLPLVAVLASLFSIGMLAHSREMIAITAAGLSPYRVVTPLAISGLLISIVAVLVGEYVVPTTERHARDIRKIYIEGNTKRETNTDIFATGVDRRFFVMKEYRTREGVMIEPTIIRLDEETGRVNRRISATSASLIAEKAGINDETNWRLHGMVVHEFNPEGRLISVTSADHPVSLLFEADLHKYLSAKRKPEEMNATELRGYIHMLEAHGETTGIYRTDFWLKLIFPFATFVFVIAGFAFAMRAQAGSLVVGFTFGILYAVAFYFIVATCQAMGHKGVLPPFLSVAMPTAIFAALSAWFLKRSAYTLT